MNKSILLALGAVAIWGCGAPSASSDGAHRAPVLRRVMIPALDTFGPEKDLGGMLSPPLVSVSGTGVLAFTRALNAADRLVTLMDTTGRIIGRIGRQGEGPGELGVGPARISLRDSVLVGYDFSELRFVGLRYDGSEAFTGRPTRVGFPASFLEDSADFQAVDFEEIATRGSMPPVLSIQRVDMRTGDGRTLVDTSNTLYRSIVLSSKDTSVHRSVFASSSERFAMANAHTRELAIFTSSGDSIARIDSLGLAPTFMLIDDRHRVWLLAQVPATDSMVVALFDGPRRLAPVSIRCKQPLSASLRLPFLAVLCSVPHTQSEKELELLLYVVEERVDED